MKKISEKKLSGVTLIELMAVIAIIGILTGISVSLFFYFRKESDFNLAVWQVANSVRESQIKARAIEGDSDWGVYVEQNKVTIFKGNNFSGRDINFDEVKDLEGIESVSGNNPLIIRKFTGFPQNPGDLILVSDTGNKIISINEKGTVNY